MTINVNGETYVHEAYALGLANPGESGQETTPERQALADFIAQLNDLPTLVGADELGEQKIFEAVRVRHRGARGRRPVGLRHRRHRTDGRRLAGRRHRPTRRRATCTVVSTAEVGETLAAANQLTFFDDAGVTYQVLAKPILPGTNCG